MIGLFARPSHWLYWLIRFDSVRLRAIWLLLLVPTMELLGLFWWRSWSNLGHLLGFACGVVFVAPPADSSFDAPLFARRILRLKRTRRNKILENTKLLQRKGKQMGIFQKISDIVSANLNDLSESWEHPEQMLRQAIREMEESISTAVRETAQGAGEPKVAGKGT